MHPAFSVIFLTTFIGVGQGFFLALYTGQVYSLAKLLPLQEGASFYSFGSLIVFGCLFVGLIASMFHLGHPERAWRSAAQWRTSWLSREVIILPLFMILVLAYSIIQFMDWTKPLFIIKETLPIDASLMIGLVASIVAFILFLATTMIYASLKFLQEWATPLTFFNFTFHGLASGFSLAAYFSIRQGENLALFYAGWAILFTFIAFISRMMTLYRNHRIHPKSSTQTAVGIRHHRINQKAMGFMGGSFNTREFFHGKSPFFITIIRTFFILFAYIIPIILLILCFNIETSRLFMIAFAVQMMGLIAERWHFFAEARHPQNIYYQSMA